MKGDIYYHSRFPFYDGHFGEKLFVVLTTPQGEEPYLVAKTTSQIKHKFIEGCNPEHYVFYIPQGKETSFQLDTVIQLSEFFEFTREQFLQGHLTDKTITHKGRLPDLMVSQIVNCIRKLKDDISEKHFKLITR